MRDIIFVYKIIIERSEFENFKSNVCHDLERRGSVDYLIELLSSNLIVEYWETGKRVQSLYLLGMADYLSRLCNVPLCISCIEGEESRNRKIA